VVIFKLLDVVERLEKLFLKSLEFDTGNKILTVCSMCVSIDCISAAARRLRSRDCQFLPHCFRALTTIVAAL
jgi:hypothetical protein